ncbi:MAG: hypothetical protein R2706_09140 [Acidimicrobiales bacterium]
MALHVDGHPASVFTVNMDTGERTLLKATEVLGGFGANDYDTRREWATADDGTKIPISLVWRRRTAPMAPARVFSTATGRPRDLDRPGYSTARLMLLDQRLHLRHSARPGGGEMGRQCT